MGVKLVASSGGSVELVPTNTASNFTVTVPAVTASMLTDSSGVMNIGSGQIYKDSSGNVGIGTSSPNALLNVNGTCNFGGSSGVRAGIGQAFVAGQAEVYSQDSVRFGIGTAGAQPVSFYSNSTERMRIDSSGCLVVNSTAKISNTTYLSVQGSTASSNIMEQKDTGTSYASGNYYQVYFNSTNGVAGGVAHTAATTVAFNTSSDARLKKNIVDAPSALDKVVAAQVRSFDWKDDDRHVDYGFIAQELYEQFPEAVGRGDDAAEIESPKSTWQVEYGRLTPMLIKAIQEQQAIITSLTDRITALENK